MSVGGTAVTRIGDGETVVLMLHGLGGDRQQPLGLLSDIDPSLTIVAPDQRAHGESRIIGDPSDFTLDQLARDAAEVIEAEGLADRPLIVSGISMGAAVALRLLERAEHDIRGALLIRPAFGAEPWPEHLRIFQDVAALLRSHGPEGRDAVQSSPRYRRIAEVSAIGAQSVLGQFTAVDAVRRVVRLENVPANTSITTAAWTPPCPVTVVGAHDDPVHPLHTAELWHAHLTGSTLHQLPSRDRQPREYQGAAIDITRRALADWSR